MSNDYTKYPKADSRQHTGLGTPPEPTLHQINTLFTPVGVSASEGNNNAENRGNRETASSKGNIHLSGGRGRVWGLFCSQERIPGAGSDATGQEGKLHSYPYPSRSIGLSDRSRLDRCPAVHKNLICYLSKGHAGYHIDVKADKVFFVSPRAEDAGFFAVWFCIGILAAVVVAAVWL